MTDDLPKRCVVTGGAGFIGSHVTNRLVAAGCEVVVVDNLASGRRENVDPGANFVAADVRSAEDMGEIAAEYTPDAWFHLAAQADVRVSVEDPVADAETNVLGTLQVLRACEQSGARLVFASTGGAIYGADAERPTGEAATAEPLSPYGAAKLAAEGYIASHGRLHGASHAILRFANVYGPRQDPHGEAGVVAIFCGKLLAGEAPTIFGDGSNTRDYVYVGDVVDATIAASMMLPQPGVTPVYNVGAGVETSVRELWEALCSVAGSSLAAEHGPERAGELAHSSLDASAIRRDLGVELATRLEEGLALTYRWMRDREGLAGRARA